MIKVFINGEDFSNKVSIGFNEIERKDYSLDNGEIVLPRITRSKPFPMFSIVDIFDDETLLYTFRVDIDVVEMVSKSPKLYEHTLSLIEHTKLLDVVIVSGKTITQPLDTTLPRKSLLDAIEEIRLTQPLSYVGEVNALFDIPIPLQTYLDTVIAKEHTFNNQTLRECLNGIVSIVDAVVRLNNLSELELDFFDETNNLIGDITEFQNESSRQTIEYYATQYEADVVNSVFGEEDEGRAIYYPSKHAWSTPRSSDFIYNADNAYFVTNLPIYEVKETLVNVGSVTFTLTEFVGSGSEVTTSAVIDNFVIDIGNRTVEEDLAKTLDSLTILNLASSQVNNKNIFAQENVITYKYGVQNIQIGNTFGLFGTRLSLVSALYAEAVRKLAGTIVAGVNIPEEWAYTGQVIGTNQYDIFIDISAFDIGNIPNRIKYTPIPKSLRVSIDREDISNINIKSSFLANQQSRIVDISSFKNNLFGRVNKLGNDDYFLAHRVKNLSDSYNIGDYTSDNYIISNKEVIFFKEYFVVKYELTKNFNKLSQFIGVNSEIRQYEIGESGRTLDRQLLYKEYIEIGVANQVDTTQQTMLSSTSLFKDKVFKTFNQDNSEPILFATVDTTHSEGTYEDLILPLNKSYGGNTITLSFELPNNASAGLEHKRVNLQSRQVFVPYTDSVGRLNTMKIYTHNTGNTYADFNEIITSGRKLPNTDTTFDLNTPITIHDLNVFKDSREVIKGSLAYQFMPKTSDVIIGEQMTASSPLIYQTNEDLYIRYYTTTYSKSFKRIAPFSPIADELLLTTELTNSIRIDNANISQETLVSYAIIDSQGRLYLAVNNAKDKKYINIILRNQRSGISLPQFIFKTATVTISNGSSVTTDYVVALYQEASISIQQASSINVLYNASINVGKDITIQQASTVLPLYEAYPNPDLDIVIQQANSVIVEYLTSKDAVADITISQPSNIITTYNAFAYPNRDITIGTISSVTVEYDTARDVNRDITITTNSSVDTLYDLDRPVEWVSGGTQVVGANQCLTEDDVGNAREAGTESDYQWATVNQYISSTNDTNNVQTCSVSGDIGNQRIICDPFGSDWLCREQECVEIIITLYETCEVKGL